MDNFSNEALDHMH